MLVVNDKTPVREQLSELPQRSSPTGRVAAYPTDVELMGRSQAFIEVLNQVDGVCNTSLPVLLISESATVKELVASAIHHCGSRRDKPFVAVNCGAFAAELIDGLFEEADGGTIFLDEITETNLSLQEKLLHVLQTGEIGSDQTRRVDVRVIAAGNRNLEQEVTAGRFRSDLFYHLNAAKIVLPPSTDKPVNNDWVTLSEIEGRYVARVLEHTRGNKQAAARVLSVDRKTLDRMIKRHHIIPQHTRGQRVKVSAAREAG